MKKKQLIISVGREFGSGGHEIAQGLADHYGLTMYDHDLLKEIAAKKNLNGDELTAYDEVKWNRFLYRTVRGLNSSPEQNVANLRLKSRVTAFSVDVLQPAPRFLGQFDLIVSNPPYVTTQEMAKLDVSVWAYEPHLALEGGADGLDFYRAILRNFDAALRPGGTICFEFGFGQETALTELLQAAGYEDVTLRKDLRGVVRAVSAKKPEV